MHLRAVLKVKGMCIMIRQEDVTLGRVDFSLVSLELYEFVYFLKQ